MFPELDAVEDVCFQNLCVNFNVFSCKEQKSQLKMNLNNVKYITSLE